MHWSDCPKEVLSTLRHGVVIPASPLPLDKHRACDPRRHRALARQYIDAGPGGTAFGGHTTQLVPRARG